MFWKDNPDAQSSLYALRRLPYLSACINEGLRLGAGSMKRSPRVFAHDEIPYKGWVIPRKVCASGSCEPSKFCPNMKIIQTPISMTTCYMHMDPVVFPEPEKFDPKRWLNANTESDSDILRPICERFAFMCGSKVSTPPTDITKG